MKVNHAGEHGAVCIYQAQRFLARWTAPSIVAQIDDFIAHERKHRAAFGRELNRRNMRRCRSYWLCGIGGFALGTITGLAGAQAIAATTVAIEKVVLRHLRAQLSELATIDEDATMIIAAIVDDEQSHHDLAAATLVDSYWSKLITPIVSASTEAVIWMGMRL